MHRKLFHSFTRSIHRHTHPFQKDKKIKSKRKEENDIEISIGNKDTPLVYEIIGSVVSISTIFYIDTTEHKKTQLSDLIIPSICGFVAPVLSTIICGSYIVFHINKTINN